MMIDPLVHLTFMIEIVLDWDQIDEIHVFIYLFDLMRCFFLLITSDLIL